MSLASKVEINREEAGGEKKKSLETLEGRFLKIKIKIHHSVREKIERKLYSILKGKMMQIKAPLI